MVKKYKYQIKSEQKFINIQKSSEDIPEAEVGSFNVFTNDKEPLRKGEGTLLIFFQGIGVKYGHEDLVGNSPMSWLEESLFSTSEELPSRIERLPIEHTAAKLGFDHFITFNFPNNLTARGFSISMDNLLNYLNVRNFTVVITSFSNGATLLSEWFLNQILSESYEKIRLLAKNVEQVICAGGLFEPKDLEPKAYYAGRYFAKPFSRPLSSLFFANRHFFIKRAGGPENLINRINYLYSLKNKENASNVLKSNWGKVAEILKVFLEFQLIFLADTGQRIVLPSGAIKWYQLLRPHFPSNIQGYIAKDVKTTWVKYPAAVHNEIKHLWTLISLIGTSIKLRRVLNYNQMALQIADEWPKRRFTLMSEL